MAFRRIASGFDCLQRHAQLLDALDPSLPNAAALLGLTAQWVDIGYRDIAWLRQKVAAFSHVHRGALSLQSYAHLRMADGLVALADEGADPAIHHFQFVVSVADDLADREPVCIANFWIGRTLRKEGRYDDALTYTERGRDLAAQLGFAPMAAIMRVLESWLYFQKG